jgi:hypothetical protein
MSISVERRKTLGLVLKKRKGERPVISKGWPGGEAV